MTPDRKITRGQLLLSPLLFLGAARRGPVVFVCGDHEYSGEETLPVFARELERRYGMATKVLKSTPDQNGETDIPGLEALEGASVAVFYLRWRRLPLEQLGHIERYMKRGGAMVGLRTTSHAFKYDKGDARERWNAWGSEAFGTPPGWGMDGHTHYGHLSTTIVRRVAAKSALLEGVAGEFAAKSWLYRMRPKWPPQDATVLLEGEAVNPNKAAEKNPVAWTWKNAYGGRAFYTSLGHPGDFAIEPFQRLLVNAVFWGQQQKAPRRWEGPMPIAVPYRGMVASVGAKKP